MAILRSMVDFAIPSSLFSFKDNKFSAFASDLTGHELMRQIYDDACDVGFAIKSDKSGQIVKFHHAETFRNADNDITHWTFNITPDHARNPELAKLSVVVFNT